MKYNWSYYFQNTSHLKASSLMTLNDGLKELLKKNICDTEHKNILDIGCGNGLFAFFMDDLFNNSTITGVDNDKYFIVEAQKNTEKGRKNKYDFLCADGYSLPYKDESFDMVFSHTYLTSVPDPQKALKEAIRVTKKGGFLFSITCQSFNDSVFNIENYKTSYVNDIKRLCQLQTKADIMYKNLIPEKNFINKNAAVRIPQIFGSSGLTNITMKPIGIGFSLSDADISQDTKRQFIKYYYDGEIEKAEKFISLDDSDKYMTHSELDEYTDALRKHQEYLNDLVGENMIWEWYGGANILMIGQKSNY